MYILGWVSQLSVLIGGGIHSEVQEEYNKYLVANIQPSNLA